MKIALVQQHASKDKQDNVASGLKALDEAASVGAELVAYPELAFNLFLPQYPATPETLKLAEPIPGPTTRRFSRRAKNLGWRLSSTCLKGKGIGHTIPLL